LDTNKKPLENNMKFCASA